MSSCEPATDPATGTLADLADLAADLERHADEARTDTSPDAAPDAATVRRVVTAAARLYAHHAETRGPIDPLRPDVSPTEAVDLACALLRSRDLNPFDLALWFSR